MATFKLDRIAGIEESMKYMRLPKGSKSDTPEYTYYECDVPKPRCYEIDIENDYDIMVGGRDWELANRLSVSKGGTGHDNYLKGIVVWVTVTAPHYWWNQAQRYHWFDIVSSSSKMHTLLNDNIYDRCPDCEVEQLDYLADLISDHKENPELYTFENVLNAVPMGYELTAGVVTNYLQLKTMYRQRKHHKLSHWNKDFAQFVVNLPLSELITKKPVTNSSFPIEQD